MQWIQSLQLQFIQRWTFIALGLVVLTLFDGCQSTETRSAQGPSDKTLPTHWVSASDQKSQERAYLSSQELNEKGEKSYEECGEDYAIVNEGPGSSEVGVEVSTDASENPKPHVFNRYYCKTELH